MHIETKFNLGDVVTPIAQRHYPQSDPCELCGGTGRLDLVRGGTVPCTALHCRGGQIHRMAVQKWGVESPLTSRVGRISISVFARQSDGDDETRYMIEASGIGSGQLWSGDDLFSSTDDAHRECDLRNAVESVTESAAA